MDTPVNELDAQEIQSQWKKLNSTMGRLENAFQTARLKKLEQLAKSRREWLMKFQKKIPVVRALTTQGLKEVHIAKMAKKIGVSEKTNITLQPLA